MRPVTLFPLLLLWSSQALASENTCILQSVYEKFTLEHNLTEFRVMDIVHLIDSITNNSGIYSSSPNVSDISPARSRRGRHIINRIDSNLSPCAATAHLHVHQVCCVPVLHIRVSCKLRAIIRGSFS